MFPAAPGCGGVAGGIKVTEGAGDQAVIAGHVRRSGAAVDSGYVRLLDAGGEFVAEVPLGADGGFTFYAAPGTWILRVLAPGGLRLDWPATAAAGLISEFEISV
jgi:hypothetical protein